MTHQPLGESPHLLNRVECERVLYNILRAGSNDGRQKENMLKDFTLLPAANAIGFLADYYHLTLMYCDDCASAEPVPQPQSDYNNNTDTDSHDQLKTLRLFVKTSTQRFQEPQLAYIFRKEVLLYNSLLKELQTFSSVQLTPGCYYARNDLLVLEDLSVGDKYALRSTQGSLSSVEVRQLLRSLAALHAASIAYEVHRNVNIGTRYADILQEITVAPTVTWYTTGLSALLAVVKQQNIYQNEMQSLIDETLPQRLQMVYAMTSASQKYCNVLCHRDCWSGNVFFNVSVNDDQTALLVDFQTCRYCPPVIDVIMALYMNLNFEEVKRRESEYLHFYYSNFSANLQARDLNASQYMTEIQLLQSYNEFRLFGLIYKALAGTILMVPATYVTNEYKYIDRATLVLQHMQENETFCSFMRQCVTEIVTNLDFYEANTL